MSRVASNLPATNYNNGVGQPTKSLLNRSSMNTKSNGSGRGSFNVRSAAPPIQKETVHACPLCNNEYKDPRVLPCTHTYCFNCIKDKLMKNSRITCPKCHYQAYPFEETHLNDLPANLILSQEWRIGARPIVPMPSIKKPMTYQSNVTNSTPQPIIPTTQVSEQQQQQDKRKSIASDDLPTNTGLASIVNTFNQSYADNENRTSRSPSVQPVVSDLIKIYSEATAAIATSKSQRHDSVHSTDKPNELIKIVEQASQQQQQQQQQHSRSSPSIIKQPSQAHEENYEEITWDNIVHGTTPITPPFPEPYQSATESHHHPPEIPEKPLIHNSNIDTHRDMITSIHRQSPEKFHQTSITDLPSNNNHPSDDDDEDDDDDENVNVHETYSTHTPRRQHIRQISNTDSVHSGHNDSLPRPLSISPIKTPNQQKLNHTSISDEKLTPTSSRRSSDRFPPPPQNFEIFDPIVNGTNNNNNHHHHGRSTSSISHRSSIHDDNHTPDTKVIRTERFSPDANVSSTMHRNNSLQITSGFSTPSNRLNSISVERNTNYISPTSTASLLPATVTTRVETLLSDQKRLEREIDEQIRRLKYDYDDVRKQIDKKESSIHNEVKNIAARLDDDITEHYHRKQKYYANLAVDTNNLGNELERLKSNTNTNTNNNNNKQQLWINLEQIETNIRNIRQAVEQYKEPQHALTFAEGHQSLGIDTIGQLSYHNNNNQNGGNRSNYQNYSAPSPNLTKKSPHHIEQTITNLTPYKYLKVDHLSTLEPEAIAVTENNKKILLGICNKLFILNEYGDTLKTISLTPSIRGIALAKKPHMNNIAYISHDEIVSMIDIDSGQTLDCVKETDSSGESGTFLPLGIDTDNIHGSVYVCDYRNSCVIKFDEKLEFITQWRVYNHSDQYDEARPKLISVYGQRLFMIVEHSCKHYYNQNIAYTFSTHICDINTGNIIKIIDADSLLTQRLRWPCSIQGISHDKCYILDTMTSGKYFNGQWQKHWSRVLEINDDDKNLVTELFQLDSEAATMALSKKTMIITANGELLFVDLSFIQQQQQKQHYQNGYEHN